MLRIDTDGLHGVIEGYLATGDGCGLAIVKRDDAPFPQAAYSVHRVQDVVAAGYDESMGFYAWAGHYDLTYPQAIAKLAELAGWPKVVKS